MTPNPAPRTPDPEPLTLNPVITLTTDFGTEDPYVGIMKGVILGIEPRVRLVDLTHAVPPQQVFQGSFLLGAAFSYFPRGTVHLAVVDPGVGSARRGLAVQAGGHFFVGPDNGLFSHVLAVLGVVAPGLGETPAPTGLGSDVRAVSLTNPRFWLHPVSSTFHGRDIFAPAAAHISAGSRLEELGEMVSSILLYPISRPQREPDGAILGKVLHIDHFGNLGTDIKEEDLPRGDVIISIGGRTISGMSISYAQAGAAEGEGPPLVAVMGSAGYLEVSARNASAAEVLGARLGQAVRVRVAQVGSSPRSGGA